MFDFQVKLLAQFTDDAKAETGEERVIPYLPGKVFVTRMTKMELAQHRMFGAPPPPATPLSVSNQPFIAHTSTGCLICVQAPTFLNLTPPVTSTL
jgi:hypothetical protein